MVRNQQPFCQVEGWKAIGNINCQTYKQLLFVPKRLTSCQGLSCMIMPRHIYDLSSSRTVMIPRNSGKEIPRSCPSRSRGEVPFHNAEDTFGSNI